ncbi:NADAR domain-containing protein [Aestuariibius insulae]|uniref:NADAR domain-containing protein n=1 Tax=Aestuariibius insulae TaxID=2058287 RepID=UPI00345EE957
MIEFSKSNEVPYGIFSPLFMRSMTFEGVTTPSAEHAFQYGKPKREAVRDWMLAAPSPSLLAVLSAALPTWEINKGWSRGVYDRMEAITRSKFDQHEDLARVLENSSDEPLIYRPQHVSTPNRYSGLIDGDGENALGQILMKIREERRRR